MQFVYTFSLYIIKGILRTGNMFTLTVNHHIEYNSNPFGMGFMAMNPRINFFLGMACGTSPMCMMMPMASIFGMGMMPNAFSNPYPSISFTDPIMNCGFGSMALPMQTVPSLPMMSQMPCIASVPTFSMPTFQFPTFPFVSSIYSGSQNSDDTTYNTGYSKIKQGLLKGNLKGKESVITGLCQKYNVDIGLVLAIIGQESGFGTSNLASHNNFMGYRASGDLGKSGKGFGYFSTPEKGLEAAIKNISKYPEKYSSVKRVDMNNIDAIASVYCEGSSYSSAVKNIYNKTVRGYLA